MNKTKNTDLIYGIRTVIEAIDSGKQVDKILVRKGISGDLVNELIRLAHAHEIPMQNVPTERFNTLGKRNHQGVIAYVSPIDFQPIEEVVTRLWEEGQTPFILILDGITDVRNFGAIVRTAECAGANAVVFPAKGSAMVGSDALKTSAGALNHIPICRVKNLKSALTFLRDSGVRVVAASEKASTPYTKANLTPPLAIVMGAEDTGISDETLRMADELVAIPIHGQVQSLNVGVAAGVMLYEAVRQKDEQKTV